MAKEADLKKMEDNVANARMFRTEHPGKRMNWGKMGFPHINTDKFTEINWEEPDEIIAKKLVEWQSQYFKEKKKGREDRMMEGQPVLEQLTECDRVALRMFREFGNLHAEASDAFGVYVKMSREVFQFINGFGHEWEVRGDNYVVLTIKG